MSKIEREPHRPCLGSVPRPDHGLGLSRGSVPARWQTRGDGKVAVRVQRHEGQSARVLTQLGLRSGTVRLPDAVSLRDGRLGMVADNWHDHQTAAKQERDGQR